MKRTDAAAAWEIETAPNTEDLLLLLHDLREAIDLTIATRRPDRIDAAIWLDTVDDLIEIANDVQV